MAAWTEAQRVSVRKWLGYGNIFLQADARLETALNAVLATTDGGTRPDSSAQTAIIGYITFLDQTLEPQMQGLVPSFQVKSADGDQKGSAVELDAIRGLIGLNKLGRMYVRLICYSLGFTRPLRDVFSANSASNEEISNVREPDRW